MSRPLRRAARRAPIVLAAAAVAATPALAASSAAPLHHAMGCYSYGYGSLQFSQGVELLSAKKYGVAPDVRKHHLYGRGATGTYSRKGRTLTFKTGPWGKLHLTATWIPQSKDAFGNVIGAGLMIYKTHHVYSGVKCYPM